MLKREEKLNFERKKEVETTAKDEVRLLTIRRWQERWHQEPVGRRSAGLVLTDR